MKKLLVGIFAALMIFSAVAFANGPLLGVSFVPDTSASSVWSLSAGWDFGPASVEVWKSDLSKLVGDWTFSTLWTPSIGTFGYRAGVELAVKYTTTDALLYNGFGFIVGASKTWGPMQLFGQLNLRPMGILRVIPRVGINFLFGDLMPPRSGSVVGNVRQ